MIQSCVENSRGEARQRLIIEIVDNVVHLAEDPYGYGSRPIQFLLSRLN